jgi:hypothetical protein
MEAVFPPDFTRTGTGDVPQIPATGNKRNVAVSVRIITEISSYPTGNNNVNHRKSSETTLYPRHKNPLPEFRFPLFTITRVFKFDFPPYFSRNFDGISHRILFGFH